MGIETDFTTQLLYAGIKTGICVHFSDLGLNVLFDLLNYSAEVDGKILEGADGKKVQRHEPMNLAEMTKAGRLRG